MLRRLTAAFIASLSLGVVHEAGAQAVEVRVDPGVELIATVCRLAGRSEYNLTRVPRWAAAIDSHFAPFRNHPAVAMTRRLGFGFFIPMNLAVHLSTPPELVERTPFATATSLHRRWTAYPDSTRAYVELLRAFARETRFAELFAANRTLTDSADSRLRRVAVLCGAKRPSSRWGAAADQPPSAGGPPGAEEQRRDALPPARDAP